MAMLFSELLTKAGLNGANRRGDSEVKAVAIDSRRCTADSCFVATRGTVSDGHEYIREAVAAGSSAVVCEDPANSPSGVACAVVDDSRVAASLLSQAISDWPSRKLINIGVTGTNGKSTVTHLLHSVLETTGHSTGLLGTIYYQTGARTVVARTTTPDPVALSEMMAEMVTAGRTHLVMEVSSHALDQNRIAGVDFRVAIFTNLSGDHLDYHGTMEQYIAAKRKMFEQLSPDDYAVINRDDPAGDTMAKCTEAKVIWYGLSRAADVWGKIDHIDSAKTRFSIIRDGQAYGVSTALIGRHNVFNCLAVAGACEALGIDPSAAAEAIGRVDCIRGRLERVNLPADFQVFVDYAHTDDALRNVLGSLRPLTRGRIIAVFGCGGDRDRTKRPRMARVAEDLADEIVITSDNPRSEDPEEIISEILTGLSVEGRSQANVQSDRRAAIEMAMAQAEDGDVVLIAGKGHETYQVVGERHIDFDDVKVATEIMRRREGRP